MSAQGFIELLRLQSRAKTDVLNTTQKTDNWTGVAFEVRGMTFVAPIGEVKEILEVPAFRRIHGVASWLKGVSLHRGNVVSIVDLGMYLKLEGPKADRAKMMVHHYEDNMVAFLVDRVIGVVQLTPNLYRMHHSSDGSEQPYYARYTTGEFSGNEKNPAMSLFLLSLLWQDSRFKNPKLI